MIRIERNREIVSVTLNRPERRNALSLGLLSELACALSKESLADASAVIISGAGSTFSAGADLSELTGTSQDVAVDDAIAEVVAAIGATEIPVIAAIDGPCVGGAVDMMLACDIRVASERAFFEVPAVRLGLLYNPEAVARLHSQFPREVLNRLLVRGDRFDATEALLAGLVTHAPSAARALKHESKVHDSGALNAAAAATKRLLDDLDAGSYDRLEWDRLRRQILDSPERAAAVRAAQGKRSK